ncbi:MAG TPA: pentapeptide repeat-containing protein [Roseiarcus sp.]|nr:pentapeptide repeat-containing protein [Roseiarcus sp.]
MLNESDPAASSRQQSDRNEQLEKFISKASDVKTARKFVRDAVSVASGLWVSYLGILVYIGVAVGAVTHADLFLEKPVKLPGLGDTPLPLVAFFILAPVVFVIWHAYTLLHFDILAAKVRELEERLELLGQGSHEAVRQFRWQLPANIFVQFLAGHPALRKGRIGNVSQFIAWITLVFGPVFLLLLVQAQFLPYHSAPVTWLHRALVFFDLGLIWTLWPVVVDGRKEIWSLRGARPYLLVYSCAALSVSVALATFPGEWLEETLPNLRFGPNPLTAWLGARDENNNPIPTSLHDLLFNGPYDAESGGRRSLFSNTLVLPGFDLPGALQFDKQKLDSADYTLARKRGHFENAIFRGADLRKINLEYAQLQGADLTQANVQSAQLHNANLDGARLYQAKLQLASLDNADAAGADLDGAELQGAWLLKAHLEGASLDEANLQCAALPKARLEEAQLGKAKLQGADFGESAAPRQLPESGSISEKDFEDLCRTIENAQKNAQTESALSRVKKLKPAPGQAGEAQSGECKD